MEKAIKEIIQSGLNDNETEQKRLFFEEMVEGLRDMLANLQV